MTDEQRARKNKRDRERRAAKKKTAQAATNDGFKPVPKNSPNLTLRMRSKTQIERVKAAAKKLGLSMNTYAVEVLERAAAQ
jgi:predicted HicB family RNase H-like nuclease